MYKRGKRTKMAALISLLFGRKGNRIAFDDSGLSVHKLKFMYVY